MTNSRGVLCISHDVVVKKVTADGFVALSRQPAVVGDVVRIEFADRSDQPAASVRVVAARPIVKDGIVTHELQLARIDAGAGSETR